MAKKTVSKIKKREIKNIPKEKLKGKYEKIKYCIAKALWELDAKEPNKGRFMQDYDFNIHPHQTEQENNLDSQDMGEENKEDIQQEPVPNKTLKYKERLEACQMTA